MNNYYDVGDKDNIFVSNSSLSALNPQEGGSIINFMNFFGEKEEKKNSLSLDRGKLIHKYIENSSGFVVEDSEKPTEMMEEFIKSMVVQTFDIKAGFAQLDVDISITSKIKNENARLAEIQQQEIDFEKLGEALQITKEQAIRVFRIARHKTKAYKSKLDPTLIADVANGDKERKFITFLLGSRDKIILTPKEKEKITGMCNSLFTHPKVSAFLGLGNNDFDVIIGDNYSEEPIFWSEKVTDPITGKSITLNCKALLDKINVNHNTRVIKIKDLKSTKESLYTYQSAFEYYHTYRQLAKYSRAIRFWFSAKYPDKHFHDYRVECYIVPIESHGYYLTGIYPVSEQWIFAGREEAKSLWQRLAYHILTQEFTYSLEECQNDGYLKFTNPIK